MVSLKEAVHQSSLTVQSGIAIPVGLDSTQRRALFSNVPLCVPDTRFCAPRWRQDNRPGNKYPNLYVAEVFC